MDKTAYIISKFEKAPNGNGEIHTKCPFHDDSKPSFSIDTETGLFICRSASCGLRGNFAKFYKLTENIDNWQEVFKRLKEPSSNFDLNSLFEQKKINREEIINPFPSEPNIEPIGRIKYLEDRQLGQEIVNRFSLVYGVTGEYSGVDIAQAIIAPVWDVDGTYKTFQVRYLTSNHKRRWINPIGSSIQNLLYGGWLITDEIPYLWIVEGASDTWKLASYGVQAVGLNTKDASPAQLNKINKLCRYLKLKPIVCLDGDAIPYSEKLFNELCAMGLTSQIIRLKFEEDPGSLSYERFCEIWQGVI